MKVGDVVKWIGGPHLNLPKSQQLIGIVIENSKEVFFYVLWEDGTVNGNPGWQMEVVSESG